MTVPPTRPQVLAIEVLASLGMWSPIPEPDWEMLLPQVHGLRHVGVPGDQQLIW